MRRRTTIAAIALVTLPLLAGCAEDSVADDATNTPASETATTGDPTEPTSDPTTDPTRPTTDPPAFPEGTRRQMARGSGAGLVLVDVRAAEQDGFDRIVLEFRGDATPGWVVNYVQEAVREGSGEVVDLAGATTLDIYARGTTAPAPGYYSGPRRIPVGGGALDEVYVSGTVEGDTQVFAGLDGDRVPFRVFALTSPSRLVIDVVDAG